MTGPYNLALQTGLELQRSVKMSHPYCAIRNECRMAMFACLVLAGNIHLGTEAGFPTQMSHCACKQIHPILRMASIEE